MSNGHAVLPPKVWLAERAFPTVRMQYEGLDITLERRFAVRATLVSSIGDPVWVVTNITLPSGGPLMPSEAEFECNNTTIIGAAEAAYKATPEGATFPRYAPRARRVGDGGTP